MLGDDVIFGDIFVKWLFDLLNPAKSPQNNGGKSETKIVKISHSERDTYVHILNPYTIKILPIFIFFYKKTSIFRLVIFLIQRTSFLKESRIVVSFISG